MIIGKANLTDRELEVLEVLTEGKSGRKAAEELAITCSTLHNHLNSIYHKLGVNSAAAAIAIYNGTYKGG